MRYKTSSIAFALFWSLVTFGQSKKDSIYVFVGEKISVTRFHPEDSDSIIYDSGVKAKYKVIQMIYGSYSYDTIEFEAYDHYGRFRFSNFKNVLLFVSNENGKLYHEKYMFVDVYKTKNGRWAGSYQSADFNHVLNKNINIKPEPIEFIGEVSYEIPQWVTQDEALQGYPSPYFIIRDRKALVVWGNYVEELFELKQKGYLKSRGIF